jgi:hypothetical protein
VELHKALYVSAHTWAVYAHLTQNEKNMNPEEQVLISSPTKSPTILQGHLDGEGVVVTQGRNRVYLDGAELARLIEVVKAPQTSATTPAKARMQVFKIDS